MEALCLSLAGTSIAVTLLRIRAQSLQETRHKCGLININSACTYSWLFTHCNVACKLKENYISWKEIGKQNNKLCGRFSLQATAELTSNRGRHTQTLTYRCSRSYGWCSLPVNIKSTIYEALAESSLHTKKLLLKMDVEHEKSNWFHSGNICMLHLTSIPL